jgi:hypothetical protein
MFYVTRGILHLRSLNNNVLYTITGSEKQVAVCLQQRVFDLELPLTGAQQMVLPQLRNN